MSEGLRNALAAASGRAIRVRLGQSLHAGYWSGQRVSFSRARQDYPCECGEHQIRKGDVYMTVVPDRMASWAGDRYRRRYSMEHVRWPLVVLDSGGSIVWQTARG